MNSEGVNVWPNVVLTGHDSSKQGKSVYIDPPQPKQATPLTRIVYGAEFETSNDGGGGGKIELNNDSDLKSFENFDLTKSGFIPTEGCRIMAGEFPAGIDKREDLHRTLSVDIIIVVQGKITCHLDSGEERTIGVGGILVQRGTMHAWSNPSSTETAKIVGIVLPSNPIQGAAEDATSVGKKFSSPEKERPSASNPSTHQQQISNVIRHIPPHRDLNVALHRSFQRLNDKIEKAKIKSEKRKEAEATIEQEFKRLKINKEKK